MSDITYTFVGCSITAGEGLLLEKDSISLYANIVSKKYSASVNNLAIKGNTNYNIFLTAVNALLFGEQDTIFVQWSGLHRIWLHPGPDTRLFLSHTINQDYSYRGMYFSKKELQKLSNQLHLLNHEYNEVIELINYCKIITAISNTQHTRVVFINGLVPWTGEITKFSIIDNLEHGLSEYTKELLEYTTRSDSELRLFGLNLENLILELDATLWVNQFDSFDKLLVDVGEDNMHPGTKTHQIYASKVIKYLEGI